MRTVVIVAAVLGFGALSVFGLRAYSGHDRPELIDDPVVVDAVEGACAAMTREVRAVTGDPVQTIRARNAAVVAMIDAVRAVGGDRIAGDRPTALWLADWRTLLDARAGYADDLAAGRNPEWVTPAVAGTPIADRLVTVGVECAVPPEIAEPR